jgi:iron(III) transport system substrate-binding protein
MRPLTIRIRNFLPPLPWAGGRMAGAKRSLARGARRAGTGAFVALIAVTAAHAQFDPAHLTGPDRTARLIAGAKKEGRLTVYSSAPIAVMNDVVGAFTKKYGVRVDLWRGASEDILSRVLNEARGGRFADVVETAGPQIEAVNRAHLLEPVDTPVAAELMPEAIVRGRPWIASRLTVFTIAYNTNLVRAADAPKSYAELAGPQWKGKLGVEADDSNWLMAMDQAMGAGKAVALFRAIAAKNGVSLRKGHSLLANLVASGEVTVALDSYLDEVAALKKSGAPIATVYAAPVIAMPTAVGVFARAAHPYAAVLFEDFLLSEDGQKILARHDVVTTNMKVPTLPKDVKLSVMDVGRYLDEAGKWQRMHRAIFSGSGP